MVMSSTYDIKVASEESFSVEKGIHQLESTKHGFEKWQIFNYVIDSSQRTQQLTFEGHQISPRRSLLYEKLLWRYGGYIKQLKAILRHRIATMKAA
jgi:hypothetical protein